MSLVEDIIKAYYILHSFVRRKDGYKFGFQDLKSDSREMAVAIKIRNKFIEYLDSTEGKLK